MKALIRKEAKRIGIDKIGFADATPFYELEESLIEQKQKGHTSGFEHPNIKERIYPELIFDNPQSFISIALAYPSHSPIFNEKESPGQQGEFSRVSWGLDYHQILNGKLDQLIDFLKKIYPDAKFKSMVDTGEVSDVAVAVRSGIGFVGKNGLLITPEFGSYVYLGEILTDIPFEPDKFLDMDCGDCTRCIDFCPTGALLGDGRMNAKKCLSYQTQTKESMPKEFREKMGSVIYGCDICQQVCPYNKGIDIHRHAEMEPIAGRETPHLHELLTISNREFKEKFGELSGSWRGKKPLQRNSIIAMANLRDRSGIPLLLELMENDPRPVIRETAAWAVGRIAKRTVNQEMLDFLVERQNAEVDFDVKTEIALTYEQLKNSFEKRKEKRRP